MNSAYPLGMFARTFPFPLLSRLPSLPPPPSSPFTSRSPSPSLPPFLFPLLLLPLPFPSFLFFSLPLFFLTFYISPPCPSFPFYSYYFFFPLLFPPSPPPRISRPRSRRPVDRDQRREGPAEGRLFRRDRRRPVEDDRRRRDLGAGHRRPDQRARRSARSRCRSPIPNIVFIGMGESCIRGNILPGDGVYKSTDAGKTWTHVGFSQSDGISKIRIHPTNPNIVFVASFGKYSVPSEERGVFKSTDGGKTWRKVLYRDDKTGAHRHLDRSDEPERDVRGDVGGVSQGIPDVERRAGQRPVQVDRRRRDVDGDHARNRACRRASTARSASPCRAPTRTACTRSSRTRTAGCSAPTTPARRGS